MPIRVLNNDIDEAQTQDSAQSVYPSPSGSYSRMKLLPSIGLTRQNTLFPVTRPTHLFFFAEFTRRSMGVFDKNQS